MEICLAAEVQIEQAVLFLEMRAASWSLLAMTNTNTGGTFTIFLIGNIPKFF